MDYVMKKEEEKVLECFKNNVNTSLKCQSIIEEFIKKTELIN